VITAIVVALAVLAAESFRRVVSRDRHRTALTLTTDALTSIGSATRETVIRPDDTATSLIHTHAICFCSNGLHGYKQHWLVAWHSGRTSAFGRRTFPVLRATFSWRVTTYVGKLSAKGQPTRPTQPFMPSGRQMSSKLQLYVSCLSYGWCHMVNTYKRKAGIVYLQAKPCDLCLSTLRYT